MTFLERACELSNILTERKNWAWLCKLLILGLEAEAGSDPFTNYLTNLFLPLFL